MLIKRCELFVWRAGAVPLAKAIGICGLAMRSGWPGGPDRGALAPMGRANSEPRSVAPQRSCGGPKTANNN